ncbi:MAG: glycosyltransferase [Chloroflexi bacterium]|nr:glycosyltransferase [Chloroflexota bacterium]
MANFWFVSAPMRSHTDWGGMYLTAEQLKRTGHRVRWLSGPEIAGLFRASPVPFHPLPQTGWHWPPPLALSSYDPAAALKLRYTRALDTWLTVDQVEAGCEALLQCAKESGPPDAIISEPFLPAAALAAEALAVRFVVAGMPAIRPLAREYLQPIQMELAEESADRLNQLCARFGVVGRNFSGGATPSVQSQELHLSYFTKRWYLADAAKLLPQNVYCGGLISPAHKNSRLKWLQDIPEENPLALITLGTTFKGNLRLYSRAAQAVSRAGCVPIITLGNLPLSAAEKQALLSSLPPRTHLLQWVPFRHILPRISLAIQHGGMGTTHAILLHGIPQIVLPQVADQRVQAKRVTQAKVGLHLSAHDVQQGKLFDAANALLNDPSVLENCCLFAGEMRALGGPIKAAETLAHIASTG